MKQIYALIALALALVLPTVSPAQSYDDILSAKLLTGWRQSDGTHMAAVQITLKPGWKTYWRAPGDAGIPPIFDMSGSKNLRSSQVVWPRPQVFYQSGMRSIGYHDGVVLPLRVVPRARGKNIELRAQIDIGVCKDICIPQSLNVSAVLPASGGTRDPRIAAALADRPYSAAEANAGVLRCAIHPGADGIEVSVQVNVPKLKGKEAMVIEARNPLLWVSEPRAERRGNTLSARAQISHVEGAPFMLDRGGLRVTVLGTSRAIEWQGCAKG